ncbi:MAG: ABC transporter ATP-binding protein [Chitinispirillia bacterium]|jgi:ATP-binding cassette subfamily B protein
MITNLKFLWRLMKGNRFYYIAGIGAIGFSTLISFMVPMIFKTTIDSVLGKQPITNLKDIFSYFSSKYGSDFFVENLWILALVLVLLTVCAGVFSFFSGKWLAIASEKTAENIKVALYDHIQNLPYNDHVNSQTGDIIQRCTSDVETIRTFIAVQFREIGRAFFLLGIAVPLMISLHVKMTLVAMLTVPVILAYSLTFFVKVQRAFKNSDEAEGRMSSVLQENLTSMRVVRAFAREKYEFDKFEEKNIEYRDLTYKLICILARYWSVSELMTMFQVALILLTGTFFALSGKITIGTLVAFIAFEGMILFPIRQMGRILTDMGKAIVSIQRIKEILDKDIERINSGLRCPSILGNIEFENVHFGYVKDVSVLYDISFTVKAGMTVGIIGPTGSGKSTLISLLLRLYDYTGGSIRIDGVELRDIEKSWIRTHIGIVLQEPFLYAKTIKENIGLALKDYTDSQIVESAKMAMINDSIENFESGYNTLVGERGVNLSGGQKQRVAIARAVIKNSPILIFDDSLSAVDNETDKLIRKSIYKNKNQATRFIISHRLASIYDADLILVLDRGKIIESGNHEELLLRKGMYYSFWKIQNVTEERNTGELEAVLPLQL